MACNGFKTFGALDKFGLGDKKEEVKQWCDGFVFGSSSDIYNPWGIINFLENEEETEGITYPIYGLIITNRESGFGRYDVMIEPKDREGDTIILEFKVFNPRRESSLGKTVLIE